MTTAEVVGIDSDEWEELRQQQEDAILSEVAETVADLINDEDTPLGHEATALQTEEGWAIDLPVFGKVVRMRLELLDAGRDDGDGV